MGNAWSDRRILDLFGIEAPILLAPMAGAGTPELAIAVGGAGGLAALACSQLSSERVVQAVETIRAAGHHPLNLNFFCHIAADTDPERLVGWRAALSVYYQELGLDPDTATPMPVRRPFDDAACAVVESAQPEVVSFHFGLPAPDLLERVKKAGAKVIASATTVAEAQWLEARGCDAVIAMGLEAGGHRGSFLSFDPARQVGTFALVPQVADAVAIPVIAAGGVADARGIVAALALGAAAVQIGTAYLFCPETRLSSLHLAALRGSADDSTMLTNLFTGRPARGIANRLMRELGPLSPLAPPFPMAAAGLAPLRAAAESNGSGDFSPFWAGQAAPLARSCPAGALTIALAEAALALLAGRV